jgi:hypothetical protein
MVGGLPLEAHLSYNKMSPNLLSFSPGFETPVSLFWRLTTLKQAFVCQKGGFHPLLGEKGRLLTVFRCFGLLLEPFYRPPNYGCPGREEYCSWRGVLALASFSPYIESLIRGTLVTYSPFAEPRS